MVLNCMRRQTNEAYEANDRDVVALQTKRYKRATTITEKKDSINNKKDVQHVFM